MSVMIVWPSVLGTSSQRPLTKFAFKPALRRLNLRENELEDEGAVTIARVGVGRAGAWASVRVSVGWAVLG